MPEDIVDILVTTPGVFSKLLSNSKLLSDVCLCSLCVKVQFNVTVLIGKQLSYFM